MREWGTWQLVSAVHDGTALPAGTVKRTTIVFRGRRPGSRGMRNRPRARTARSGSTPPESRKHVAAMIAW